MTAPQTVAVDSVLTQTLISDQDDLTVVGVRTLAEVLADRLDDLCIMWEEEQEFERVQDRAPLSSLCRSPLYFAAFSNCGGGGYRFAKPQGARGWQASMFRCPNFRGRSGRNGSGKRRFARSS